MISQEILQQKFEVGHDYNAYLKTGTDEQRRRWLQVYERAHLTTNQQTLVSNCKREINLLVISGIWCGDCVQQVPLIRKIEEANPQRIRMRIIDRDEHKDLSSQFRINGGDRVPVVLFLSEDFQICSIAGDRTLHRYRYIADQLLAPSCPTALVPPAETEMAATLADWCDECERIHLMLRLSPRLRQRHND